MQSNRLFSVSLFILICREVISISIAYSQSQDDYLNYLPLSYPTIISQTDASKKLQLYRDTLEYKDANSDGIDDKRHEQLLDLSRKFSPKLIKNSSSIPLDFRAFINKDVAPLLYIDTWDITKSDSKLIKRETINFSFIDSSSCHSNVIGQENMHNTANEDCQLLNLLQEFDPKRKVKSKIHPNHNMFKVLYFDFPGKDEKTWRQEYQNIISKNLPDKYKKFSKIYAHPFIHDVYEGATIEDTRRYEFVIQYWFFYPFNDSANNHEGDWEHINVVITFKNKADSLLSADNIHEILNYQDNQIDKEKNQTPNTQNDSLDRERKKDKILKAQHDTLVIKRVEYYFHHYVMILDYMNPNVYQPYEEWKRNIKFKNEEKRDEYFKWKVIRRHAYSDDDQININTHPIAYIGGDNKGWDQVLTLPGENNRDSHGTYPLPGIYNDIGPAGATEQVSNKSIKDSDNFEVYYDDIQKIEIIPDWELLDFQSRNIRQKWSWLVLPIRWGYPASQYIAAGIVEHADTGNISPVGPACNSAWSRVGACDGYSLYNPHILPIPLLYPNLPRGPSQPIYLDLFQVPLDYLIIQGVIINKIFSPTPLSVKDKFSNRLGMLNLLTIPLIIPPLSFAVEYIRILFEIVQPIFTSTKPTPAYYFIKEPMSFRQIGVNYGVSWRVQNTSTSLYRKYFHFSSYIGRHFVTEFQIVERKLKQELIVSKISENQIALDTLRSDAFYSGSFRYNILAGSFQPFIKSGYTYGTAAFATPIRLPPDMWHIGVGLEYLPLNTHFGMRFDYQFSHKWRKVLPIGVNVIKHQLQSSLTLSW